MFPQLPEAILVIIYDRIFAYVYEQVHFIENDPDQFRAIDDDESHMLCHIFSHVLGQDPEGVVVLHATNGETYAFTYWDSDNGVVVTVPSFNPEEDSFTLHRARMTFNTRGLLKTLETLDDYVLYNEFEEGRVRYCQVNTDTGKQARKKTKSYPKNAIQIECLSDDGGDEDINPYEGHIFSNTGGDQWEN